MSIYIASLIKIPCYLLKLSSGNEIMGVSRADNSVKIWRNLPISNPKPDLHNINAHTKFGENPLMFTQVIIRKRKTDGWTDGRQAHGRLTWNHNTPPLLCGGVKKQKLQNLVFFFLFCICVNVQADLSIRWAHMSEVSFSHTAAHSTKTYLYNFDPLKPHFYTVKLWFTEVYIIFLFLLKNIYSGYSLEPPRLVEAVLTSTHNLCFEQKYEKYQNFFIWKFSFFFWW